MEDSPCFESVKVFMQGEQADREQIEKTNEDSGRVMESINIIEVVTLDLKKLPKSREVNLTQAKKPVQPEKASMRRQSVTS